MNINSHYETHGLFPYQAGPNSTKRLQIQDKYIGKLNSEINEMVMVHMLVGKLSTYPDRIKTSIIHIKESEKNPSFLFIIFSTIT